MMENPQERLAYYRETGQTELAKEYEQYLRETGQMREPMAKVPAAASDASRVAPRADGGGDLQSLLSGGQGKAILDDVVPALGAHAVNAAQSIPFMRNVQAGALSATSPMNYRESLKSLDDLTSEIPGDLRAGEQIAAGALPWTKGLGVVAPLAKRGAGAAGAFAKELPFVKNVVTGAKRAGRAWNASKPAAKIAPKIEDALEVAAPKAPKSLDDIVGNLELIPEAKAAAAPARTLEDVIEQAGAKPWKPRGRTKAQFEHFAEGFAKRQAAQTAGAAEAAEPALEDLLALSLDHIKKGGSMKSASDALKLVRRQ